MDGDSLFVEELEVSDGKFGWFLWDIHFNCRPWSSLWGYSWFLLLLLLLFLFPKYNDWIIL